MKERIQSAINKSTGAYLLKIEKVHIPVIRSGIELKNISLQSKLKQTVEPDITGEIESLSLRRISLIKALFKKDIDIGEVTFFNSYFTGKISFPEESMQAGVFSVNPNYTYYEFTSRHHFETDRIEALFTRVSVHGFSAVNYITSGDLISSFIEIGEMDMNIFRDKRKEFRHVNKPALQNLIYDYPGKIDEMNFSLTANNTEATGSINLLYHDLNIKVKNRQTDETSISHWQTK